MMDFRLKLMDFVLRMMDFVLKMMNFVLKMMDFVLNNALGDPGILLGQLAATRRRQLLTLPDWNVRPH